MADHKRVFAGQKIRRPSASLHNDLIELLQRSRPNLRTGDGDFSDRDIGSPALVEIVNDTEPAADLPLGELVELGNTTTTPPESTDLFKMLPRRLAKRATESTPKDRLAVVTQGALRNKGVGLAAIVGQCVVRVVASSGSYDGGYLAASSTAGAAKFQASSTGAFARAIRPNQGDRSSAYAEEANRFCLVQFLIGEPIRCVVDVVRHPGSSGQQKGLYKYFSDAPETPVLIAPIRTGYCPTSSGSSGGDGGGGGCSTEGYEPGVGWIQAPEMGYDAAFFSTGATDPPADPPGHVWVPAHYTIGSTTYYMWRIYAPCNWIARGAHLLPP